MIIPPAVKQKHTLVERYVSEVAARVQDVMMALCHERGYAYLGRTKDPESLSEKIETGRFACWDDLEDLFACSVIVPSLSDEPFVLDRLRAAFVEVVCKQRGTTSKDPSVFRFDATRFVGRLRPESVPGASDEMLAVRFEVQVRSAFEHAWSVTTHALAYKSSSVDWRHLRLAAQLRASIEQLDQVVLGFEQTAGFIAEQDWPEVKARQRIRAFFASLVDRGVLPSEVVPNSWGRFSENLLALIRSSEEKRIDNLESCVQKVLGVIQAEVEATLHESFPRSISLLQFCIGAMAKQGILARPMRRFVPLITGELRDLYPDTKKLGAGFDLQLAPSVAGA